MSAEFKLTVVLFALAGFLLGFAVSREVVIGFLVMFAVAGVLVGFWTLEQHFEDSQ